MFKRIIDKYQNLPLQIKASFWFLICSFVQKAISALTTPIFTRLLSNSEYGQFSVYSSWQLILGVFLTLNLFCGIYTSGLVKHKEKRLEFVSAMQGLTIVFVGFWTIIYALFSEWINKILTMDTYQVICLILSTWATAVFSFWSAEQRVEYKYKKLVFITIVVSIMKPVLGIILVICFDNKVAARIVGLTFVELVCYTWMFVSQVKRHKNIFSAYFWKYALRFNIPLIPHYLAQNILETADRIMINKMVSSGAAGIYSLAYSVSLIMNLFNTALTQTISPWVYEKIKTRNEKDIQVVMIPTTIIIAGVNLLLIALAPEVIRIFAPPEYYEAIWTIPPVVMSVYFTYLYNLFSYFEFYYEKTSFIALATVMAAGINIVLNYVFIGKFGYIAAGYTTLVCYMLYALGHYRVMCSIANKYLDRNELISGKKLIIITVLFMISGFVFCALYRFTILRYALLCILFIVLFIYRRKILNNIKNIMNVRKIKI